jgi:hypothetical protein
VVDDAPFRSPRYMARGNSSLTEDSAGLFATDVYALSAAICDARAEQLDVEENHALGCVQIACEVGGRGWRGMEERVHGRLVEGIPSPKCMGEPCQTSIYSIVAAITEC